MHFDPSAGNNPPNPIPVTVNVCGKAFVTKVNPSGTGLVYSTYLGGSNFEVGLGIAVDSFGSAYVTGTTYSTDFPLVTPMQSATAGAFVAKLKPDGSGLVYSTYLGSKSSPSAVTTTFPSGIAVDSSGAAYVAGTTSPIGFPTTPGSFQSMPPTNQGDTGFISKIDPSGTLLNYSTYLDGQTTSSSALVTFINGLALDSFGHAFVTGNTNESDFPLLNPVQATFGGGSCPPPNGFGSCYDAFVTGLKSDGSGLVFSTYLGGSSNEFGIWLATDPAAAIYAVGQTASTNFPTTGNAFDGTFNGGTSCANGLCYTGYVAKLQPLAPAMVPSSLTFADQIISSSSATQSVSLMNPSSQALSISNLVVSGDFSQTNDCGTSLAGNSSCTVLVTFRPTAAGQRTGLLSVGHDGPAGPLSVSLSGNGTDFSLAPASGSASSATIAAGQPATYHMSLSPQVFSGTVNLSCSEPTPIPNTVCTVSPSQATLSGSAAVPVTVTVTTMARSGLFLPVRAPRFPNLTVRSYGTLRTYIFLMMLLALLATSRKTRRRIPLAISTLLLFGLLAAGCGSMAYNGGGNGGSTGTPAGMYQLVVSATASGATRIMTLTLTVQ